MLHSFKNNATILKNLTIAFCWIFRWFSQVKCIKIIQDSHPKKTIEDSVSLESLKNNSLFIFQFFHLAV
jgi:hypothetical protein